MDATPFALDAASGWVPDPAAPPHTPELASYLAAGGRLVVGASAFVFGDARLAVTAGCGPTRTEVILGTVVGPKAALTAALARLGDVTNAPGNHVLLLPVGSADWLSLGGCVACSVGFSAESGGMVVVQDIGLVAGPPLQGDAPQLG